MKVFPCAKINLGLYVTERRSDGYHNLETVFLPIPLCDELSIEEAQDDEFQLGGIPLEGDATDNLVIRALKLLRDEGHSVPPLCIRLVKNIPSGAGLGGGSSDATATLVTVNQMFHLGLSDTQLERLAARLGADCPFFVYSQPVLATGIGDIFHAIPDPLPESLHLLLVKPDEGVSTREAYQGIKPKKPQYDLRWALQQPIGEWQNIIANDFEQSVFPLHPVIRDIKEMLLAEGAVYAAMSGSGSAVFGLFQDQPRAETLDRFEGHFVFSAQL